MEAWTNGRIERQPWQHIPGRLATLGLSSRDGMTQVWFVTNDGRLYGGAAAVNEALRLVWWARPLTNLYRLPGVRQLEDKVYRWVADNRYRLPGGTATCSIDTD
ncbi:MAG TPA: DUF393 domain-containing protein [Anaerolineae bacterium]